MESKQIASKQTILNEIKYLRGMQNFLIDTRNSNRYCIMVKENLGRTAYCFSTPIYNIDTRKLVNQEFCKTKFGFVLKGSNGTVTICQNRCTFENQEGKAVVSLKDIPAIYDPQSDDQSFVTVFPTLNGLRFLVKRSRIDISVESEIVQENIRFNSSCFSIMREKFRPFLSVSTLYASNEKGFFAPVNIKHSDNGFKKYELELSHNVQDGTFFLKSIYMNRSCFRIQQ